jgi:hypothetical protein
MVEPMDDGRKLTSARLLLALSMASCTEQSGTIDAEPLDGASGDATIADAAREDAALRDAEPIDAEPIDAEPNDTGVVMTGCAGSTALFCEDFESLAVGPAMSTRWDANAGAAGSITIDDARARGARSLHLHTDGNSWAFLGLDFAPPNNSFFGRVYVYVTTFPSAPDWAHFTLVEATGVEPGSIRPLGGQYVPPGNGGGASFWGIGSDGGPTGDWTDWRLSAPAEGGRWSCMEFELDASNNRIQISIDGVANPELSVTTTSHGGNQVDFVFPTFDRINFGWQLYQPGPTPPEFDVWLDDIVLDTEPVGC